MSLFRLVEPCGGRVIMDGIDTSKVGLDDLRQSRIAIIPQDPTLFSGTVRYNLECVCWCVCVCAGAGVSDNALLRPHVSRLVTALDLCARLSRAAPLTNTLILRCYVPSSLPISPVMATRHSMRKSVSLARTSVSERGNFCAWRVRCCASLVCWFSTKRLHQVRRLV